MINYKKGREVIDKYLPSVALTVLVLLLVPYLWISQYTVLSSDDYCRVGIQSFSQYWHNLSQAYLTHNGRYFNLALVFIPLWYDKDVYGLIPIMTALAFICSFHNMLKTISRDVRSIHSWLVSVMFALSLFSFSYRLSSNLYWFASVSAYIFPMIALLMLFSLLVRSIKNTISQSISRCLGIMILEFIIIGSHEVFMIVTCGLALIYLLCAVFVQNARRHFAWLNIFWTLFCTLLVIFSPGTAARKTHFDNNFNLGYALRKSIIDVIDFIQYNIEHRSWILAVCVFLSLFLARHYKSTVVISKNKMQSLGLKVILALSIIIASALIPIFVYNFSTDNFSINYADRHNNMILNLFFLGSFISSCIFFSIIPREWSGLLSRWKPVMLVILFMLSLNGIVRSYNFRMVWKDLASDRAVLYHKQHYKRLSYIRSHADTEGTVIRVPKIIHSPESLMISDLSDDPKDFKNSCLADRIAPSKQIKAFPISMTLEELRKMLLSPSYPSHLGQYKE